MGEHIYIREGKSLFGNEDVDDNTFVESYRSRIPPPQPKPSPYVSDLERQRQCMLEKQKEIEQRTLDSSVRSIALLRETGDMGIATAEELARQREKLQVTSSRLDEINTNLNQSQKHLKGIQSIYYGFKNYLSGKTTEQTPSKSQVSPSSTSSKAGMSSKLDSTANTMSTSGINHFNSHPTTRLRELDQQTVEPIPNTQRINKMLDDNLDEMVSHITMLKGLGMALGDEIEQQNHLIDEIHDKVDVADIKIGHQNKQMNKLLGK